MRENVLRQCFSKAQPKAHEYVVPEIRNPDNMGPESSTKQNRNRRAPTRSASFYHLVIQILHPTHLQKLPNVLICAG